MSALERCDVQGQGRFPRTEMPQINGLHVNKTLDWRIILCVRSVKKNIYILQCT